MLRTYKFLLYPTKVEKENIHFVLERCRLLYNRLLAERIAVYKQTGLTTYLYRPMTQQPFDP
ncbi:MAG: helix-turn-helix domain-containing protein [Paenibacillaceae bacterium]